VAQWIPERAILTIHKDLLAEHGGLAGPTNQNLLGATLARLQQLENYSSPPPTVFQLAAAYGYGFARNHCFSDGNKRIALAAIDVFLIINGLELVASEAEAVVTINDLAAGELTESDLAEWIENNSQ
jgi:death-on-curing protein